MHSPVSRGGPARAPCARASLVRGGVGAFAFGAVYPSASRLLPPFSALAGVTGLFAGITILRASGIGAVAAALCLVATVVALQLLPALPRKRYRPAWSMASGSR